MATGPGGHAALGSGERTSGGGHGHSQGLGHLLCLQPRREAQDERAPVALAQALQQAAKMTKSVIRGGVGHLSNHVRRVWLMADEQALAPAFSPQLAPQRALDDGDDEDAQRFGIAKSVNAAEDAEKGLLLEVLEIGVGAEPSSKPTPDERSEPLSN